MLVLVVVYAFRAAGRASRAYAIKKLYSVVDSRTLRMG
jgi:hypothetical protein